MSETHFDASNGFPAALFDRLALLGIGARGQRILDIGATMGSLARGFAERGSEVVVVDPSEAAVEASKERDAELGLRIDYVVANPERTMLDERSFDAVSMGQVFDMHDRNKMIREVKRVVRPGGLVVIAYFDAIPLPNNAVASTERLVEKYNPEWRAGGGTGVHPHALTNVRAAGFVDVETFSFDLSMNHSHEAWRRRVRANTGVSAGLASDELARLDETLRRTLADEFPEEPMTLPHCVWALTCRAPS
jgi:SAM-dependent methyltransferase